MTTPTPTRPFKPRHPDEPHQLQQARLQQLTSPDPTYCAVPAGRSSPGSTRHAVNRAFAIWSKSPNQENLERLREVQTKAVTAVM